MKNFDFYLNKAIKILLVINICILLTILSFFFAPSSFALDNLCIIPDVFSGGVSTSENINTWYSQGDRFMPIFRVDTDYSISNGFNFYFCVVKTDSSNTYNLLYACDSATYNNITVPNSNVITAQLWDSNFAYCNKNQLSNYDSSSGLYYYLDPTSRGFGNNSIFYCYVASSLSDGLNYISLNSSSSSLPNYDGLRIPTGYYARIEFQNNSGSLTLNTTMSIASNTFGTPWPNSSQQWLSSGVSSAESFGNSSKIDIVWSKGGKPSIFGTTYQAIASLSSSNQYIWIYNPIQMNPIFITDGTYYPPNDVITISDLVNVKSVRLYSVTASIFGPATTSDSDYYDSVVSSDGAIGWVDSNGDISTPSNGGGNSQSTDSDSVIQQFRSILSDLVGRIESLLVAPVEYIQRIINAGSTFFSWLAGLWSWLPPAVSGILTSVLYIMAVVGALKLLWR